MGMRARLTPGRSRAGFTHQRDSPDVVKVVSAYAEPGRYVDTSTLRRGENTASGRRETGGQRGVETEEPVGVAGADQHRSACRGHRREAVGEGIECRDRAIRVDHILP